MKAQVAKLCSGPAAANLMVAFLQLSFFTTNGQATHRSISSRSSSSKETAAIGMRKPTMLRETEEGDMPSLTVSSGLKCQPHIAAESA